MKDRNVLIFARGLSVLVYLVGGSTLQVLLWKTPDGTYLKALMTKPALWMAYLFVALVFCEHFIRAMKRRRAENERLTRIGKDHNHGDS